jgi:ATP-dependent RNA helicase RhlE
VNLPLATIAPTASEAPQAPEAITSPPGIQEPPAPAAEAQAPATVVTFNSFGLAEPIQRAVAEMGYTIPTPIQEQAIPVVIEGRDVMGAAQTGTGKTAGFALPILQRLMVHANTSASPARHPVRALILAPTRELADQIYANVREYAKYSGLRSTVVFGGVDMKPQTADLRAGCEILIATPGRLLDHVGQKTVSLGTTEILVLDEADRMLDMGFMPDIQRIIQLLPPKRQNLMFSATFSGDIRKLAESILRNPISIEVARRNATSENVEQQVYLLPSSEAKRAAVAHLVRERKLSQVIVFSNTKIGCSRLARQLERDGLNSAAIHGDKTQQERLATLEAFKKGTISILVATDVAARGLDIVELPAVINYDLPHSPEDYVHRIGRTGRAGASGVALSLMTSEDARYLGDIEKLIKRKLPQQSLSVEDPEAIVRADRAERRARDHRDREDHRERKRHSPDPINRLPGFSNDDFFFKPYEEGQPVVNSIPPDSGGSTNPPAVGTMRPGIKSAKRPVPALLGGGAKST